MAFYLCEQESIELPEIFAKRDLNNSSVMADENYFDVKKPIYTLTAGKGVAIPVGNNKYINILLDSTGLVTATKIYSNKIGTLGTPLTVQAATAVIATYGFNIVGVWYVNQNEFLMMYNWKTAEKTLSPTYTRLFGLTCDQLYMSNVDTTFGASLVSTSGSVAGSCYAGYLFKTDFNGNGSKIGIAYLRDSITAANVNNQRTLWHGYMAAYTTVNTSFKSIAKAFASTLQVNVSTDGYKLDLYGATSNVINAYAYTTAGTARTYFIRDSATNVGGTAAMLYTDLNTEIYNNSRCIGKLLDDIYVYTRVETETALNKKQYLDFYEIAYASTNTSLLSNLINSIELDNSYIKPRYGIDEKNFYPIKLLNNNILLIQTDEETCSINQIIYNNGNEKYELDELGDTTLNLIDTTTTTKKYFKADILDLPRPKGAYSDVFRNIGNDSNVSVPDDVSIGCDSVYGKYFDMNGSDYLFVYGAQLIDGDYKFDVFCYDKNFVKYPLINQESLEEGSNDSYVKGYISTFNTDTIIAMRATGKRSYYYIFDKNLTLSIIDNIHHNPSADRMYSNKNMLLGSNDPSSGSSNLFVNKYDKNYVYQKIIPIDTSATTKLGYVRPPIPLGEGFLIYGSSTSAETDTMTSKCIGMKGDLSQIVLSYGTARNSVLGGALDDYALLLGGDTTPFAQTYKMSAVVDAYNKYFVRSTPTALNAAQTLYTDAVYRGGISKQVLFNHNLYVPGGRTGTDGAVQSSTMNIYNNYLVRSTRDNLADGFNNSCYNAATKYYLFTRYYTDKLIKAWR